MIPTYITTPIYYVNAAPHLGHAHTSVMCDILKRYRCMLGLDIFLSTGTDEHGQKNQEAALASGLSVDAYLTGQSAAFQDAFDRLEVAYDYFVRTTRPAHKAKVQEVEATLNAKGLIEKQVYRGLYCTGCEQFKKDSDLDANGFCLDHPNLKAEATEEANYFLKMEPFRAEVIADIEAGRLEVAPEQYKGELLAMLSEPLEDLCISRPKARLTLGVDLPFDSDFVTYVWIDALMNYLTTLDWPTPGFETRWRSCEHVIGKDILKTHGVFWPIILKAAGIPLPQRISVHGHWLGAGGVKMSKSLGNVVDPFAVIAGYGASGLRWYLARHMRAASDSQISVDLIRAAYTTELANTLGNLLQRLIKFSAARFDGALPKPETLDRQDALLRDSVLGDLQAAMASVELASIPKLAASVLTCLERLNEYVTREAPWSLMKDPSLRPRAESVVYAALDGLRLCLEALWPIMPVAANKGLIQLGQSPLVLDGTKLRGGAHLLAADRLVKGGAIGAIETLFPRVEEPEVQDVR